MLGHAGSNAVGASVSFLWHESGSNVRVAETPLHHGLYIDDWYAGLLQEIIHRIDLAPTLEDLRSNSLSSLQHAVACMALHEDERVIVVSPFSAPARVNKHSFP